MHSLFLLLYLPHFIAESRAARLEAVWDVFLSHKGPAVSPFLPPRCFPSSSCLGRCGGVEDADGLFRHVCRCDGRCSFFGDCCVDYDAVCALGANSTAAELPDVQRPSCLYLPELDINAYVVDKCLNESASCSPSTELVWGEEKLLYKNADCLRCNHGNPWRSDVNFTRDYAHVRPCIPAHDNCPHAGRRNLNRHLSALCGAFNDPIYSLSAPMKTPLIPYKNPYCALCNGAAVTELACPKYFSQRSGDTYEELFRSSLRRNPVKAILGISGLPSSFSILLNFGPDGREKLLITSHSKKEMLEKREQCGASHIWNPFSKKCLRLYCSTDYVLVDLRCVKMDNNASKWSNETTYRDDKLIKMPSSSARLTLSLIVVEPSGYVFVEPDEAMRLDALIELEVNLFISRSRIKDLNLTLVDVYHNRSISNLPVSDNALLTSVAFYKLEFFLTSPPSESEDEVDIEDIVAQMVLLLNWKIFKLKLGNMTASVFDVHQDSVVKDEWCRDGNKLSYWNEEFTIIFDKESNNSRVKEAYINKTGKSYARGHFVASVLFQGYHDDEKSLNVSGEIRVCDPPRRLKESCPRLELSPEEYVLTDDTLLYLGNISAVLDLSSYERASNNGSIFVCFSSDSDEESSAQAIMEEIHAYLSLILSILSILFLSFILATYLLFKKLRNLPGCNLMNLSLTFLLMQVIFLLGQREGVTNPWCRLVGIATHYLLLASFFWMGIMAYDLYSTFGCKANQLSSPRGKGKMLWKYMLWAYGGPFVILVIACIMDYYEVPIGPQYGAHRQNCWIGTREGALVFFALPLAAVLIFNVTLYVLTVRSLAALRRDIGKRLHSTLEGNRSHPLVYVKMAVALGFTWILAFVAAFIEGPPVFKDILVVVFISFNAAQGIFLFLAFFVANRQIWAMYGELLGKAWLRLGCSTAARPKRPMTMQTSVASSLTSLSDASSPRISVER